MPENYGFQGSGEFAPAFEAAMRRLQGGYARQKGDLAQAVASRGVRTSGVSFIPQETVERGQSEAQAGLIGDFALRQANEGIEDRRLSEGRAFQERMMERGYNLQDALQRRLANKQLEGQLIAGGISGAGSLLMGG
jgi:hypothetical protein